MITDRDENKLPTRIRFNPGESLVPALEVANDEKFKLEFASYAGTMTKTDLSDKFVLPVYAAKTLDDFTSFNPLSVFATKQVEMKWEPGDPFKVPLVERLTGAGVTDGTALDGAEEELSITQKSYNISEYANANAWTNLASKTSRYSIEEISRAGLRDWAVRKVEAALWNSIVAELPNLKVVRPNKRASKFQLTATDLLDSDTIKRAKWFLRSKRTPGFAARDLEGRKVYNTSPIGFYVMVMPAEALQDLDSDAEFKAAKQQAADLARGLSPWESDVYLYNGVFIVQGDPAVFALETIGSYTDRKLARGIMFGMDSYILGFGKPNKGEILEFFYNRDDYARKIGLRVSTYFGGGVVWPNRMVIIEAASMDIS